MAQNLTALVATAGALPANTYTAGSGAVADKITMTANGALTVDGYSVSSSQAVLVKNEANQVHNGLYTVTVVGDGSTQAVLTRSTGAQDAQGNATVVQVANNGTVNALSTFLMISGSVNSNGVSTGANIAYQWVLPNNNTITGDKAVAFGYFNTASGDRGVALGYGNTASGLEGVASGNGSTASGTDSVADGLSCTASAQQAAAFGVSVVNATAFSAEIGVGVNKFHVGQGRIDGAHGMLNGYVLSNNGTSPTTKIDIAAGTAIDSTNLVFLTGAGLTKQLNAAWGAGTTGGLFSGSVAASTVYHVFVIRKDSDESIDFGFDTSVTAANKPAGYTYYRRIGSVLTDGSSNIRAFHQYGDEFHLDTTIKDIDVTNPGTAAVTRTLTVPTGVKVCALVTSVSWDSTQNTQHYVSSLDATDETPSYANAIESGSSNNSNEAVALNRVWTNTSAQVRTRLAQSGVNTALKMRTTGWVDLRGKD